MGPTTASESSWVRGREHRRVRRRQSGNDGYRAASKRSMTTRMRCRELVDFLEDYVAGTLDAAERRQFEAHLPDCRACAEDVRSYRDTIHLEKDAARDDEAAVDAMPPDLVAAIVAA